MGRINRIVQESKERIENSGTLNRLPKGERRAILVTLVASAATPGWGVALVGGFSYCLGKKEATKEIAERTAFDIPEMFRGTLEPILPALEPGVHETSLVVGGVEYPVKIQVIAEERKKIIDFIIYRPGREWDVFHRGRTEILR